MVCVYVNMIMSIDMESPVSPYVWYQSYNYGLLLPNHRFYYHNIVSLS